MKHTVWVLILLFALITWCTGTALADTIIFHDNTSVTGTITKETPEEYVINTDNGVMTINKKNVLYAEKPLQKEPATKPQHKTSLAQDIQAILQRITGNNWHYVRVEAIKLHTRVMMAVARIPFYTKISEYPSIATFRRDNPAAYYLAFYMVLLLIAAWLLGIVQGIITKVVCRIRNIKQPYDL